MKHDIAMQIKGILATFGLENPEVKIDYPENPEHGDFTSNVALVCAKKLKIPALKLAEQIVVEFSKHMPADLSTASVAGPGFINFKLKDQVVAQEALKMRDIRGFTTQASEKVLIEYTDPNTFKVFHVGHLMSNAIGESISRLLEHSGKAVVRICYPSDIGLHIAKALWAVEKHRDLMPADSASIQDKTAFLGKMYVEGTAAYEKEPSAKNDIDALNKIIYAKSSSEIHELYEKGRSWSLEHFDQLYKTLGTKFDDVIYESEMAPVGLRIAQELLQKGIFEVSEGATVFKGENFGLHTRVFINSQGIPTYEAKDLGLNVTKFKKNPDATASIIVTASEQNDYFKVLTKVISLIDEKNGDKTKHIGHGMMRFADGKMSSRTGNVVTADALLADIEALVMKKIAGRTFSSADAEEIASDIAVGAIKYTILRSSIGSDIIFDSAASISFEGDSGPYLQYSVVRAASVLEKAGEMKGTLTLPEKVGLLEKLLVRFPDSVERARNEYAPQVLANYLINLAGAFNSFYASQTIIDEKDPVSAYRLALTQAFKSAMTEGLWLLGIKVPKKM